MRKKKEKQKNTKHDAPKAKKTRRKFHAAGFQADIGSPA